MTLVEAHEAGAGIEPANSGFADRSLTTWLPRHRRKVIVTRDQTLSIGLRRTTQFNILAISWRPIGRVLFDVSIHCAPDGRVEISGAEPFPLEASVTRTAGPDRISRREAKNKRTTKAVPRGFRFSEFAI